MRLPENVVVDVVIVTKAEGRLQHRVIAEELTAQYDDLGLKQERDAFDTLFDHAPDKLQVRNEEGGYTLIENSALCAVICNPGYQIGNLSRDHQSFSGEFRISAQLCPLRK